MKKINLVFVLITLFVQSALFASDLRFPIAVKQGESTLYGFIDEKGILVKEAIYNGLEDEFKTGFIRIYDNIENVYKQIDINSAFYFVKDELLPSRNEQYGQCGYVNIKGEWIIPQRFNYCEKFSENAALVFVRASSDYRNNKYFFIDKKGKPLFEKTFTYAESFSDGYALVAFHDQKFGDWVREKRIKTEHEYMGINADYYQYVNKDGRLLSDKKFVIARSFSEGLAQVKTERNLWGYVDTKGKMVIKEKFYESSPFKDGVAVVVMQIGKSLPVPVNHKIEHAGQYAFQKEFAVIDKRGKSFLNKKFNNIYPSSEGLMAANIGGIFIVTDFGSDGGPSEGFYDGKWGFIDKNGKTTVDFLYDEVEPFRDGLAKVYNYEKWGKELWAYIDKTGKIVWEPK